LAQAIVFYISGHGFGHASRSIEVINAILAQRPETRVGVRTSAPRWLFDLTVKGKVTYSTLECDTGVVQSDAVTLDEAAHPLVRAITRSEATYFDAAALPFRPPIEGTSFHAIPLRDEDTVAYGLLLASASGPDIHPDVLWLARVLAKQIARLLSRQTLAETRFGQERMLLYSIINAVTDPILLTDTEGKLIIANTHA
jgi:hypothetical protein